MTRVDPVTADQIRQILLASRSRGVDPVAILDRADLLDYRTKRQLWSALLVEQVVEELRNGQLGMAFNARISGSTRHTPMDVKNELLQILEGMAQRWRKEAQKSKPPTEPAT